MDDKQYKIYLEKKRNHLKEINNNSLSKKEREKIKSDFYKPILEELKATLNSNGIYEFNNFNCNISTGLAKREGSSLQKLHNILEGHFYNKFKKSKKKQWFKLNKVMFLYCCKCKDKTDANLYKQGNKYYWGCNCGLKVETNNNSDFPQPLGNIPTKEIKKAWDHLNKLLDSFCKKSIKKRIKLCNYVQEKTKSLFQFKPELIKTVDEGRKAYKIINSYINQGLINVKRI